MGNTLNVAPERGESRLLAPMWHTAVVIAILVTLSVLGARAHSAFGVRRHNHVSGYLTGVGVEWLMLGFVWFGLRLRGNKLADLLGKKWSRWTAVLRDLGLALAFLIGSNIILAIIAHLLKASPNQAVRDLAPKGTTEVLIFLLLSLSAGVCEEILFRGYLQQQFAVIVKSAWASVLIQGIIFGTTHGYQGPKYMVIISVYGCLFGSFALWRRSLLPGMTAHFMQDGILGSLLGQAMKRTSLL